MRTASSMKYKFEGDKFRILKALNPSQILLTRLIAAGSLQERMDRFAHCMCKAGIRMFHVEITQKHYMT